MTFCFCFSGTKELTQMADLGWFESLFFRIYLQIILVYFSLQVLAKNYPKKANLPKIINGFVV